MADKKISELVSITGSATAADDYFVVVDTSGAVTYKISREELNNAIEQDVLENISITNLTSDLNTNGNDIIFGDNDKAIFGAGDDLQIFHDGLTSYISDQGTGNLKILAQNFVVSNPANNKTMMAADPNAAATISYDGAIKLATTAIGVDVTGGLNTTGNVGIGVVPTTDHNSVVEALQIGSTANLFGRNDAEVTTLTSNAYLSVAGYPKYITTNEASEYTQSSGNHIWFNAPSGTAGAACTLTERMRISGGNLLVGKTSADGGVAGFEARSTGETFATSSGATLYAKRTTGDGDIIVIQGSSGTVGSIGTFGGDLIIGTGDIGLYFYDGATSVIPWKVSTNAASDNYSDLGHPVYRWKNFYLSGGVYLGGTGAANYLDDYEEGDYDVTVTPITSGSVTLDTSYNRASYTKVGRLVTVNGFLIVSSVSSPVGYFTVTLPFTAASLTDRAGDSVVNLFIQNVSSANVADFVGAINEGTANFFVQLGDGTTVQSDSAQELIASTYIAFSVTYPTT